MPICPRYMAASWAAVPEAAVHKYREPLSGKEEIGSARDGGGVEHPTGYSSSDEHSLKPILCRGISERPNGPHIVASNLSFGLSHLFEFE